jgi:hypothetical protein
VKTASLALSLIAVSLLSSCEELNTLRSFFHGEDAESGSVIVEVDPASNIEIWLDGRAVSQKSPYESGQLSVGQHSLEVRSPNYYSVRIPVGILQGKVIRIPVKLRPKKRDRKRPGPAKNLLFSKPTKMMPPPTLPSPQLPAGISPIPLIIKTQPKMPLLMDGLEITGSDVTLERVDGTLATQRFTLKYRVGGAGTLELQLNGEVAHWARDGRELETGSFQLPSGATRLELREPGDEPVVILIRRP